MPGAPAPPPDYPPSNTKHPLYGLANGLSPSGGGWTVIRLIEMQLELDFIERIQSKSRFVIAFENAFRRNRCRWAGNTGSNSPSWYSIPFFSLVARERAAS